MAEKQGVTEQLKAEKTMEWIGSMGNIQSYAREIVNTEIFFIGLTIQGRRCFYTSSPLVFYL